MTPQEEAELAWREAASSCHQPRRPQPVLMTTMTPQKEAELAWREAARDADSKVKTRAPSYLKSGGITDDLKVTLLASFHPPLSCRDAV